MKKIPYLHILLFICIVSFVSIPTLVFAQATTKPITDGFLSFKTIIDTFSQTIVRSLATLFATAAMVAFFFGIVQFIWGSREGKPEVMSKGKNFMVWGLVALFVMFSVWGIINYAQRIFGIQGQNTIIIPQIELGNGKTQADPSSQGLPILKSTYFCPTNGKPYNDPSEYQRVCVEAQGGVSTGSGSQSSADCTGKSSGTSCTVSGRAGTCSMSDEGVFGCYVNAGGASCTSNQTLGSDGRCYDVNGF